MKNFIFLPLLFISLAGFATILTVSNNPATLAQHSTIQAAIDASASGDTVYVHGSPNTYAAFTLNNKQLVIIGPGWAPNKNLPLTALVAGCTITGAGSSDSEIQGLYFLSTITINNNHPNGLRFIRNRFRNLAIYLSQGSVTYSDYLFEGNHFDHGYVIGNDNSATYENFLFQNNLFYDIGSYSSTKTISGFTNSVNVLFNHNLWIGPAAGRDCFDNNCRFLTLTNNIFVHRNAQTNNSSSTFNNNITFNAGNNTPWMGNGNIDGGGNIENQDPQMVDQAAVNAGTNNPLLDFTIAAGPANNSGSDGKDMGLLYDAVGSLNWTTSRTSRLPYIFSMNITNPTVTSGGNLSVEVEARKNN